MNHSPLPLLPLCFDRVPEALLRMLGQEGIPLVEFAPHRAGGTFVLFDSRHHSPPTVLPNQRLIDVDLLRRNEACDPLAADDALQTTRTYWSVGPWEVGEETAAVDMRDVRERIMHRLRTALTAAGGVWMRTAAFPYGYRTAANFRFDHDAYHAADFAAVLRTIRGHEGLTTHFICGATHESHADTFHGLRGLDVGSHGYHHHTYRTCAENVRNITRGIDVLQRRGIDTCGFAAPHGRYNAALAQALDQVGIKYSSEFAAAYDDLPYEPIGSRVLQLPIHPVCLGIVLEAAQSTGAAPKSAAAATQNYFAAVVAEKYAAAEPIFLYGHPDGRIGRYPDVLARVLREVDALADVWQVSLGEFHRWWRRRAECRFSVWAKSDGYEIHDVQLPTEYPIAIEWQRNDAIATIHLREGVTKLQQHRCSFFLRPATSLSRPTRTQAPHGWKQSLRRILDWEYETPLDEIDTSNWRGWLKRRLRTVKGRRCPPSQQLHSHAQGAAA